MSLRYLARRLVYLVATALIVSLLVFGITQILPANAATMLLGEYATPQTLAALERKLRATLSFLGLGSQPPAPEWGLMVSEARGFMFCSGWTIFWPGLAIAAVAITFNLLGDALRDALEPRVGG